MIEEFIIEGGRPLEGAVSLAGAKNSINKVLIASLLTEEPVVFENVPDIGEVDLVVELVTALGSKITRRGRELTIETPEITNPRVPELSRKNRIPILALGPLLIRAKEGEVPTLGGDKLGPRPINFHLEALERFGAKVEVKDGGYRATTSGLRGTSIDLPYPSVGATETVILSAVCAKGATEITNAATEPEVIDLVTLLQKMGAIIELGAARTISIEGVERLRGTKHRIMPDRNEAASFGIMAVATNGNITVDDARQGDLITFLNAIRRVGGDYEILENGIRFFRKHTLRPLHIETDTHPGFMTDWQQPFAVLLTQAAGESIIHETVYEDRFGYVEDLRTMGAEISVTKDCLGALPCRFQGKGHNHTALIRGVSNLHGASIAIRDIRAGMAQLVAALVASGKTHISGAHEVDRGYEHIDERIRQLGAVIERKQNSA